MEKCLILLERGDEVKGFTNNQLKILAVIAMTVDHMGMILFPQAVWMRAVGRLAFPIFAFMIAQGCHHTRNMGKYLGSMAAMALLCQLVMYFFAGSLYQTVLVTFSMSIGIIWLLQQAEKTQKPIWILPAMAATAAAWQICNTLPGYIGGDFSVDYGFVGVLLPVAVYLASGKRWAQLLMLGFGLSVLAMSPGIWEGQWLALLAIVPLALYNGQRGKWKLKWFFYLYFPLHMACLYGIAWVL